MRKLAPWFIIPAAALLVWACGPGDDDGDDAGLDEEVCEESCDGTVLTFCTDDDEEETFDCADIAGAGNAVCEEITPAYGLACAVEVGENCFFQGDASFGAFIALCQGDDPGCFDDAEGIICTENIGPCSAGDVGTCDGEIFTSECTANQPFQIDCESYGGTCGAGEGCLMPPGEFCDDFEFFCEDGADCQNNTCP